MKVSDDVWDAVNLRSAAHGFLATASKDGLCDVACFSSLQFSDTETMTMLIGNNRSLENLKENPNAAFVVASGDTMEDVQGYRVYLSVEDVTEEGPVIEKGRMIIAQTAGEEAARMVTAFVTFRVVDVRPLVDIEKA